MFAVDSADGAAEFVPHGVPQGFTHGASHGAAGCISVLWHISIHPQSSACEFVEHFSLFFSHADSEHFSLVV